MKKIFCYLLFVVLIIPVTTIQPQDPVVRCGTTEYMNWLISMDPELQQKLDNMEVRTQLILEQSPNYLSSQTVIVIPVVVHVIWRTAQQNISDEMIESQITVLNEDFRRMNADTINTPAIFQGVADDAKLEFRLATVDPDGNRTNGITRTETTVVSFPFNNTMKFTSSGGHDAWDSALYLNIWVCNLGGDILGFAQFPGGNPLTDGVVILYSAFGYNSPLPPYNLGRTTTHEVGHWLNLRHIWGDDGGACSGSDFVDDTPNQGNFYFGCPSNPFSCSSTDMVQNYMDYTNDACMNIVTQGQDDRMDVAINTWRSNLLVSYKETIPVAATGTDYNFTDVNGNTFATLNFTTLGTVDTVTVEIWPNYYPVEQPAGTKAVKRFFDISAHGGTGFNATLTVHYDDTEVIGFTNNDSFLELYKYSGGSWVQMGGTVNTTANTVTLVGVSEMSIWALSDPNDSPVPVELISFTSVLDENNVNLNWTTATEINNQGFEIQRRTGDEEFEKVGFVPGHGTTTDIQAYSYVDVKVASGNYTYRLKQIDFDGSFEYSDEVTVEVTAPVEFALEQNYPNPFNPSTVIKYSIPENGFVSLVVYNLLGEKVASLVNGVQDAGRYEINFDASNLASGIYVYSLRSGSFNSVKKMLLMK